MLVVGVIHFLPIVGFLGADQLTSLYAVEVAGNDLEILMRHRAMLFGILGGFIIYAAFRPPLQPIAFIAATASLASFFYLAFSIGEYNDAIRSVVLVDVAATLALIGAIVLYRVRRNAG